MRIISGKFRGKKLTSPLSSSTRPTSDRVRETLFNILEHNPRVASFSWPDTTVLDLFAGTGALGLEAVSRGAKSCIFVENDPTALQVLKQNIQAMQSAGCEVLDISALHLPGRRQPVKLAFLDPPYNQDLCMPCLEQLLSKKWIDSGSLIIIETAKHEKSSYPDNFQVLFDKMIGATRLHFLRVI